MHLKKNGISKGRRIRVYEDDDKTCPVFTINIYNNGTVIVQESENSLDNFQNNFQKMKEDAEKEAKADSTNKTESFILSSNPSVTLSPESTPRFTNNIKLSMKDSQCWRGNSWSSERKLWPA